jgi:hypothetical protein
VAPDQERMTAGVLTGGLPRTERDGGGFVLARHDTFDKIIAGLLVVFLVFFFAGRRIESLRIPIRIEDFVYLLLLPFSYRYLFRQKTKLYWWVAAYFLVNLIPYFAAKAAGQYELGTYPIILIKELQYFYIAYLICQNRSWWVLATVDALAVIIIGYGLQQLAVGRIAYYGIGTIGTDSPSLSGAMYLFSTIWLHIRSKLVDSRFLRWTTLLVVLLGAVCCVATVSRTSIAGLIVYAFTYVILTSVIAVPGFLLAAGVTPKLIQIAAVAVVTATTGLTGAAAEGYAAIAMRILARAQRQNLASGSGRSAKWIEYLRTLEFPDWIFGRGVGYPNTLGGGFGLGVDNQYVRIVMERGLVGLAIVGIILLTMLQTIKRRGGEYQHAWAVVMAMAVMCIPMEALQVSKSGGFFWLIMFYLLFCQRRAYRMDVPA